MGLRSILDQVEPRAVLLLHLFYQLNLAAKTCNLNKFLLDCLWPLLPLAVSFLSLRVFRVSQEIS